MAWLAYHKGEIDTALDKPQKAVQDFLGATKPFSWIALVILLTVQLEIGELDQAVDEATMPLARTNIAFRMI